MTDSITNILDRLGFEADGKYENHFYILNFDNSDEYAKAYTKLSKEAVNTEYPNFEVNTNKTTTKITNYFEIDEDNITYNIFLIADFDEDKYYLKIGKAQ